MTDRRELPYFLRELLDDDTLYDDLKNKSDIDSESEDALGGWWMSFL